MVFDVCDAFADSSSTYPYCLMTGPAQDCSYNTMAQCLASKRGNADFCEPNNWYSALVDVRAARNNAKTAPPLRRIGSRDFGGISQSGPNRAGGHSNNSDANRIRMATQFSGILHLVGCAKQ
jgi:hypothetical protein